MGYPFAGILGLTLPKIAEPNTIPLFDHIMQMHLLPHNIMSFYFNYVDEGSSVTFGGVDPERMLEDITYVPITGRFYWEIFVQDMLVGTESEPTLFCKSKSSGCRAAVDSATSHFAAPSGT